MPVEHGGLDIRLATADLSGNWDSHPPNYRLKFSLACGPEILKGCGRVYKAYLKQCLVKLHTDGCKANFSEAYNSRVPLKSKVTETKSTEESRTKRGDVDIAGTGLAKPTLISWFQAKFKFGASREGESKAKLDQTTLVEQIVWLISYRGGYWAVGDDHRGDPRYEGGWLRGPYFVEDPIKPLCTVDLLNGHAKATVMVVVWAPSDQISIYERGTDGMFKREARRGNRSKALEVLGSKAILRMMVVTKGRRAALPNGLPPID